MDYISVKWLVILACATAWTTFFSLFTNPRIRGYRNLGLLACYALGLIMFLTLSWRPALGTWVLVGIVSGFCCFAYECFLFLKTKDKSDALRPNLSTIINGLWFWPVMLPESVEYWLAELGVLKVLPDQQVGVAPGTDPEPPTEGEVVESS